MHHESSTSEAPRIPVRCFKCNEGCIHLEYGNALFTFTPQQFRVLAEVVGEIYRKIQDESEPNLGVWDLPGSLVM